MQVFWYRAEGFNPCKVVCDDLHTAQQAWDALSASGFVMLSTRP